MKKISRGKRAKHGKEKLKIENDAPPAGKLPNFAARSKKIFGGRVLTVVDDLIKDRGR
jgi:hypothetical protein